nr:hypothetical protein [Tanacetum cinerariifolium]
MNDKVKGKALVFDDDQMKHVMPLIEEEGSTPSLSNLHRFRTTATNEGKKNDADIHELVELTLEVVRLMDLVPASARANNKGGERVPGTTHFSRKSPTPAQGEHKTSDDPSTKLKVVMENIPIPSPTLLNLIRPPVITNNIPFKQFSTNLFSLSSSEFSHIPPLNMNDKVKGKALVFDDDQMKQVMPLIEEEGSTPSLSNLHRFRTTGEAFELPSTKKNSHKKRKKRTKLIQEVEEEFHLVTTPQLIRIHNAIKKNSTEAKEMYNKLNFVIEARIDVVEARRNVLDNLDRFTY